MAGLVDALVAADLKAGRLTKAQEKAMLARVKLLVTAFVNGKAPAGAPHGQPPKAPASANG
jgi:hypothetical protein